MSSINALIRDAAEDLRLVYAEEPRLIQFGEHSHALRDRLAHKIVALSEHMGSRDVVAQDDECASEVVDLAREHLDVEQVTGRLIAMFAMRQGWCRPVSV